MAHPGKIGPEGARGSPCSCAPTQSAKNADKDGAPGGRLDYSRLNYSKIGAILASTSFTITSGTLSNFFPPRAPRSSARG